MERKILWQELVKPAGFLEWVTVWNWKFAAVWIYLGANMEPGLNLIFGSVDHTNGG
jgi:hypothetical protein